MAIGIWEDFTEKHGFQDGEAVEETDFVARRILVRKLNRHPAMMKARLHAVPYDPATVHNPCILALLPFRGGETGKQLLEAWDNGKIQPMNLPEELETEISDIVENTYREAFRPLGRKRAQRNKVESNPKPKRKK